MSDHDENLDDPTEVGGMEKAFGAPMDILLPWVQEEYLDNEATNVHRLRRALVAQRLRFYQDNYEQDAKATVDLMFNDPKVAEQRKKVVELAMGINPTRNVIDTVASLYDRPAKRIFDPIDPGDDELDAPPPNPMQDRWDVFEQQTEYDEVAQERHRLTYLCNETLLWYEWSPIDDLPQWRIYTPDAFDAIPDPRDPLRAVAFLIDWNPVSHLKGMAREKLTHRILWDAQRFVKLNAAGHSINGPRGEKHNMGRIPGLLLHRRKPRDVLMDSRAGRDLISAHKAVVFLNLLVMRLAKSQGEQQPILTGHLAQIVKNQSMDGENPIGLPPGVVAEMLNMKTDPDHYLSAIRHFIGGVANTYGMSYEQFTMTDTTSGGRAYTVRREKLTELRTEQRIRATRDEIKAVDLVDDMHVVRKVEGFDVTRYRTDFAEQALPMDAKEEVELLDLMMRKGLDNPIAWLMRKNPDLNAETAAMIVKRNLAIWATLVVASRNLNASQSDTGGPQRGASPEENGAMSLKRTEDPPENDNDNKAKLQALAREVLGNGA